ncbi:MAG: allophanate hydrolase [Gammaproteobacteria bacterium]|nr:MAG: allophanate hydrolase [Gammaproteobacteria bacterium]
MSRATLAVRFAGPLVSFQDAGRAGQLRYGVCASGPMDRLAYRAGQAALGNLTPATAIEISLGGIQLECLEGDVSVAVTGGEFAVDLAGRKRDAWSVMTLQAGETLSVRPGSSGSWAYLAVAGNLVTDRWLGHSATHASSGFGGGALASGQILEVEHAEVHHEREGEIPRFTLAEPGGNAGGSAAGSGDEMINARVVLGPQERFFSRDTIDTFLSAPFKVSDACDRMGMRLDGPVLPLVDALSIPSEPVLRGSVQVSGDGVPTVLLADHQTAGGYPKIATLIDCDTDTLAQARSGQIIRFESILPGAAIVAARENAERNRTYLERIAVPRGTLEQRLMRENLIHGEWFG